MGCGLCLGMCEYPPYKQHNCSLKSWKYICEVYQLANKVHRWNSERTCLFLLPCIFHIHHNETDLCQYDHTAYILDKSKQSQTRENNPHIQPPHTVTSCMPGIPPRGRNFSHSDWLRTKFNLFDSLTVQSVIFFRFIMTESAVITPVSTRAHSCARRKEKMVRRCLFL